MVFHHSRSSAYIKWQQNWNNTLLQSNNKNQKSVRARVCLGNEIGNWGISAKIGSWKQNSHRAWKKWGRFLGSGSKFWRGSSVWGECVEADILARFVEAEGRTSSAQCPSVFCPCAGSTWQCRVCVCTVRMGPRGFHCARWEQTRHFTGITDTTTVQGANIPTGCAMLGEPGSGVPPFQPTWCPPLGPPPSASLGVWFSWPCLQNKSPLGTEWEVAMAGNSECLSHSEQWGTPAAQFRALSDFIDVFFFKDRGTFVKFAS